MPDRSIPLAEEQVEISKRTRTTEVVRVEKLTHETLQPVEFDLQDQTVEIKRVPVDRFVDEPVPDRQQGDTLIVSVLEEVLVVQKRLKVVEEIHLIRRRTSRAVRDQIALRHEEAHIKREQP